MSVALTYLGYSVAILLVLAVFYSIEDKKGKRIFLGGVRTALDSFLLFLGSKMSFLKTFFGRGFFRLLFHYGAHNLLGKLLNFVKRVEQRIEHLLRKNKKIAKEIQTQTQPRTHLDEIADHKNEVALTEKQKKKMLML